jgi:hypothetical protein
MKKKIDIKSKPKFSPSDSKKEAERKKQIQEKRMKTINSNKRKDFIDSIYKKYEV